jgi:hypothetical protein
MSYFEKSASIAYDFSSQNVHLTKYWSGQKDIAEPIFRYKHAAEVAHTVLPSNMSELYQEGHLFPELYDDRFKGLAVPLLNQEQKDFVVERLAKQRDDAAQLAETHKQKSWESGVTTAKGFLLHAIMPATVMAMHYTNIMPENMNPIVRAGAFAASIAATVVSFVIGGKLLNKNWQDDPQAPDEMNRLFGYTRKQHNQYKNHKDSSYKNDYALFLANGGEMSSCKNPEKVQEWVEQFKQHPGQPTSEGSLLSHIAKGMMVGTSLGNLIKNNR